MTLTWRYVVEDEPLQVKDENHQGDQDADAEDGVG
jgi:hypothetical protein